MELLEGIQSRRSINFFDSQRDVSDLQIKELIDLANTAPSSMNLQPWEVIVVKSASNKEILKKYCFNQPKVTETSANLIIVANPEAIEENIDNILREGVKSGYGREENFEMYKKNAFGLYKDKFSETRKIFAVKNASFFAMNIMLAARSLDLHTHPMDGFIEEKVKMKFKISSHKLIPVIIALGYPKPDLNLLPRAYRRDFEDFVKII